MVTITDVRIGPTDKFSGGWALITENGSSYLEKQDIRQRIRLDKDIDFDRVDFGTIWSTSNITSYRLDANLYWMNSRLNFNPVLLEASRLQKTDTNIVYLTIAKKNNRLNRFEVQKGEILLTYHGDEYIGCAVVIHEPLAPNEPIVTLECYNMKKDKANKITLFSNPSGAVQYKVTPAQKDRVSDIERQKNEEKPLTFKVVPAANHTTLTAYWLVSKSYEDECRAMFKRKRDIRVIGVDDTNLDEVLDTIPKGVRAITLCGISIPLEKLKKKRLIYVFAYDMATKLIKCLKTN